MAVAGMGSGLAPRKGKERPRGEVQHRRSSVASADAVGGDKHGGGRRCYVGEVLGPGALK